MTTEQLKAIQLNEQYDRAYQTLWQNIIVPNQTNINQETDTEERQKLQYAHNTLTKLLNVQYDTFKTLLELYVQSPTQSELKHVKNANRLLYKYVRVLGGNPSNIAYSKESDI